MTVMTYSGSNSCSSPSSIKYSGSIPANGVVYVESGVCSSSYSPFNVTYEVTSENAECGNAYVEGNYSGQLTSAADNDIIITGNLCANRAATKSHCRGKRCSGW